jgi:ABC-2 type transport system permease protein
MTSLAALVRKEFIQAFRDPRMLFMLLMVPVVQIVIFGYAANLEFNHALTIVVDEDHTEESRAFVRALAADGTFEVSFLTAEATLLRAMQLGRGHAGLLIPRGFGDDVLAGRRAGIQILVDGTEPTRAVGVAAALNAFAAGRSAQAAQARLTASPPPVPPPGVPRVVLEPRLLYNPALKSRLFMVPGTAASILLIITTIVTAMGLAREREIGTMEQLLVTPIRPITLMIGKTVPYAIFGLFDEGLILVVGSLLFDVPIRGSLLTIFAATLVYLVGTLSVGLLISTVARTQQQALTGGFFFLMPALLLSGFLTPIESMPRWIQPLTWFNPIRYFVDVVRSTLLRGASFADVAPSIGVLALLGGSFLALAALRFRRQLG